MNYKLAFMGIIAASGTFALHTKLFNIQDGIDQLYESADCKEIGIIHPVSFTKWNIKFNDTRHHHQSEECPPYQPWRVPGGTDYTMVCCKKTFSEVFFDTHLGNWAKVKAAKYLDLW